jgi:hypothetical protein
MPYSTTYVTGFIDIPALENNTVRRRTEEYFRVSKEFLQQDIALVYFGDPVMAEHVREERRARGLLEKTVIIPVLYEDLPTYTYHDRIAAIIATNGVFGSKNCSRYTPAYLVTILAKPLLLQQAASLNPFASTHFCWHDFGFFHLKSTYWQPFSKITPSLYTEIDNAWSQTGDRLKIALVSSSYELRDATPEQFCERDRHLVAGAFFGGNATATTVIATAFIRTLEHFLSRDLVINEEGILATLFFADQSMFDVNACYYVTCLPNFASFRSGPERIGLHLNDLFSLGWYDNVNQIAWKALAGLQQGHIHLTLEELGRLFDIYLKTIPSEKRIYTEWEAADRGILEPVAAESLPWVRIQNADSLYSDIRRIDPPFTLADLYEAAENTPGCIAFTTTGWLKREVRTTLQYSASSDLFVRPMNSRRPP